MFQIGGQRYAAMYDGFSRRDFLRAGIRGSLPLPQLMAAEKVTGVTKNHKAVTTVYIAGDLFQS